MAHTESATLPCRRGHRTRPARQVPDCGEEPGGSWIGHAVELCYRADAAGRIVPKVQLAPQPIHIHHSDAGSVNGGSPCRELEEDGKS